MKAIKSKAFSVHRPDRYWVPRAALVVACASLLFFCVGHGQGSVAGALAPEERASARPVNGPSEADLALVDEWYYEGDQKGADLGYAVSAAGDVNGDGYDDVIVSAPIYDDGTANEGAVFVFYGTLSGLQSLPEATLHGNQKGVRFGCAIGPAGDVNGDHYDDVVVGACDYTNQFSKEGRAFVFYGSEDGLETTPAWTFDGGQKDAHLGSSVGTAGDVNGDGYDDVVVGAPGYSSVEPMEGGAYAFLGSPSGPISSTHWLVESDQAGALFGTSVSTAGDVNGDGYDDVIVGAPQFGEGETPEGKVFLYYGSALGLHVSPGWSRSGGQPEAEYGTAVGGAGDVNGDGYDDLIVGAPRYDVIQADVGAVFEYHGTASGPAANANWTAHSNYANSGFGTAVGTAGDVNDDGYDDVIVGAHLYEYPGGERAEGAAFVYHGGEGGLRAMVGCTFEGNKADAAFGYSVSTAGDVDGDGFDDVLVGAPEYKHSTDPYGRAFGYYGPISAPDFYLLYLPLVARFPPQR